MLKAILMLLTFFSILNGAEEKKVLICGISKDIEEAVPNAIKNIEELGSRFSEYGVIIYENNSTDKTAELFEEWARTNPRVHFVSEKLNSDLLPVSRTEKIARARNALLELVRKSKYKDFDYLIMADLDFKKGWPTEEIVRTVQSPLEWDCVSANGFSEGGIYHDRYAFRDKQFPLGPELFGDDWWRQVSGTLFQLPDTESWIPVFSAFGGLAIYKMGSIINFSYSGIVTDDLKEFYKRMLISVPRNNGQIQHYLGLKNEGHLVDLSREPIEFQFNTHWQQPFDYSPVTCCEHVPLHATMTINGFGKFYINPKMKLEY